MRYGVDSGVLFTIQHQAHPRVPDEKMVGEDAQRRDDCDDARELDPPGMSHRVNSTAKPTHKGRWKR